MIFVSEANCIPIVKDEDLCDVDVHAIILCQKNMGLRKQKSVLQTLQTPRRARSWGIQPLKSSHVT
jgi:hypothetical protein